MSAAFHAFRCELVQRIRREGLTPNQVADELEREGFEMLCGREIADLRYGLGDSWRPPWPVGHLVWNPRTQRLDPWPHPEPPKPPKPMLRRPPITQEAPVGT